MDSDQSDKLDEVASDLDELKTTVEELEDDPPQGVDRDVVKKLGHTIEKARDITDDLEDDSK